MLWKYCFLSSDSSAHTYAGYWARADLQGKQYNINRVERRFSVSVVLRKQQLKTLHYQIVFLVSG